MAIVKNGNFQEYPTKPLHKKTALRAIVDLAG